MRLPPARRHVHSAARRDVLPHARLGLIPAFALLLALAVATLATGAALPSSSTASAAPAAPAARAATTESPWAPVSTPAGASWAVHDLTCVGTLSLALAGDGHVAVSRDGGKTWKTSVPGGRDDAAFTCVAFAPGGRGVVASGGLLLVTSDWGVRWAPPAYVGPGPTRAVADVALRGSIGLAVGDNGTILASSDGGATWQRETSPVVADLTSVALTADGTAVAGSADGDILVRTTAWAVAGAAGAPITGVTTVATPAWGDGQPDLFAATEHDVLGSDDALTFASLPGLPDLSAGSWGSVAWAGRPDGSLLIAGSAGAGYFSPAGAWVSGDTGLNAPAAAAPPGQSAGYLLGADGRLVRTLSAGRAPAAVSLSKSRVGPGGVSVLSATVRVAAPGTLLVRSRVPGGSWTTLRTVPWTADDWGAAVRLDLKPTLTHDYVLQFKYGQSITRLAPVSQVTVVPRVTTAKARYVLSRGGVFRFSGTVSPRLRGGRVELFTDRGGSWRPVRLQRSVALVDGRSWQSRQFGTPIAETYHLRAHLPSTRTHAEAWSRIVTVTIR